LRIAEIEPYFDMSFIGSSESRMKVYCEFMVIFNFQSLLLKVDMAKILGEALGGSMESTTVRGLEPPSSRPHYKIRAIHWAQSSGHMHANVESAARSLTVVLSAGSGSRHGVGMRTRRCFQAMTSPASSSMSKGGALDWPGGMDTSQWKHCTSVARKAYTSCIVVITRVRASPTAH
jgi:hypothetical protein